MLNYLVEKYGYHSFITTTSRPMRPNEKDGLEYHFVTEEDFLNKIKESKFVEYISYKVVSKDGINSLWYYGTEKQYFKEDTKQVLILDPIGASKLKDLFSSSLVTIVFLDSNEIIRKQRNISRGDYEELKFINRNIRDIERMKNSNIFAFSKEVSYTFVNDFENKKDFYLAIDNFMKKNSK